MPDGKAVCCIAAGRAFAGCRQAVAGGRRESWTKCPQPVRGAPQPAPASGRHTASGPAGRQGGRPGSPPRCWPGAERASLVEKAAREKWKGIPLKQKALPLKQNRFRWSKKVFRWSKKRFRWSKKVFGRSRKVLLWSKKALRQQQKAFPLQKKAIPREQKGGRLEQTGFRWKQEALRLEPPALRRRRRPSASADRLQATGSRRPPRRCACRPRRDRPSGRTTASLSHWRPPHPCPVPCPIRACPTCCEPCRPCA